LILHVQEAMPKVRVAQLCRLFKVPRSSFYYQSSRRDESTVKKAVEEIAATWPRFGYQGLTGQLRFEKKTDSQGKPIGERRVKRALKELGLLRKPRARKVRTTNSEHGYARFENLVKEREATRPDEIWASDLTYIKLGKGFVYLSVILDLFTRSIRSWHLSRSLGGEAPLLALKKALDLGHPPQIHHSDQGVQYASDDYVKLLHDHHIAISMAAVGCPEENGFVERWMRTLKEDHVSMSEYDDFWDCQAQIGEFIEEVYQRKRVHSSLGYLPPAVFEERWWEARARRASESDCGDALAILAKPLPFAGGRVTIPQA